MSDAQNAESAHLIEVAKYEALATIVSEYLRHAATVYKTTVEAEGGVTEEARAYAFNSVELMQVVSTVKQQMGIYTG